MNAVTGRWNHGTVQKKEFDLFTYGKGFR